MSLNRISPIHDFIWLQLQINGLIKLNQVIGVHVNISCFHGQIELSLRVYPVVGLSTVTLSQSQQIPNFFFILLFKIMARIFHLYNFKTQVASRPDEGQDLGFSPLCRLIRFHSCNVSTICHSLIRGNGRR